MQYAGISAPITVYVPDDCVEHHATRDDVAPPGRPPSGRRSHDHRARWGDGDFTDTGGSGKAVLLGWNGKAWEVVSSPNVLSSDNFLTGVAAVSNEDIWAVGSYFNANSGTLQTLLEHWNGHHWSLFFTMNPPAGNNALQSVTAITEDNVWAVGTTTDPITNNSRTLIEHWNGRSWRALTSPNPQARRNLLSCV